MSDSRSITISEIKASATRRQSGWHPALEYPNGGRVIGDLCRQTHSEAVNEAREMLEVMAQHPVAFKNNHPAADQLIDLSLTGQEYLDTLEKTIGSKTYEKAHQEIASCPHTFQGSGRAEPDRRR